MEQQQEQQAQLTDYVIDIDLMTSKPFLKKKPYSNPESWIR